MVIGRGKSNKNERIHNKHPSEIEIERGKKLNLGTVHTQITLITLQKSLFALYSSLCNFFVVCSIVACDST